MEICIDGMVVSCEVVGENAHFIFFVFENLCH
jgi:hypothetical protein